MGGARAKKAVFRYPAHSVQERFYCKGMVTDGEHVDACIVNTFLHSRSSIGLGLGCPEASNIAQ